MYQPVSSLRGMVVITSVPSVKMHWYTPASDKPKLVIWSPLVLRRLNTTVSSVMVILPPSTTCSPFLTHTTEGGLELPVPAHLNSWLPPTDTANRLSGKPSLTPSIGFVPTVSALVLAAEKIVLHKYQDINDQCIFSKLEVTMHAYNCGVLIFMGC